MVQRKYYVKMVQYTTLIQTTIILQQLNEIPAPCHRTPANPAPYALENQLKSGCETAILRFLPAFFCLRFART